MFGKKSVFVISFLAILGFLFYLNAPTAKAMTSAEIRTLIGDLQRQIIQLQQQLAQIQETEKLWCHDFNIDLKIGDSGGGVAALKTALGKENIAVRNPDEPDYFGEYTASGVVEFQEKYASEILIPRGLNHGTGFVGTATREKLNKAYGCKTTPISAPVSAPVSAPAPAPVFEPEPESIIEPEPEFASESTSTQSTSVIAPATPAPATPAPVTPFIELLSPNGGEELTKGQRYFIKWASLDIETVMIGLDGPDARAVCFGTPASAGMYHWTVPRNITPGDYKISIGDAKTPASDSSDNYFSIAEAPVYIPASCTYLSSGLQSHFETACGNADYDPVFDLNKDGIINIADYSLIHVNTNDKIWCDAMKDATVNPCAAE